MADNSSDFGAFLSGFILGGLVGAAAALMMAPQSGEETREQIRTKGIELRNSAEEEARQLRARAEATLADVRAQADEIQKKTAELVEDARTRVGAAVEEGKNAARQMRTKLSDGSSASES